MRSRLLLVLSAVIIALLVLDHVPLFARGRGGGGGGGRGGGGGGFSRGGGSFARGGGNFSGGGGNFSGGERSFSRGSGSVFSSSGLSGSGGLSRGGNSSFSGGGNSSSSGGGGRFSGSSNSFSSAGSGGSSRYFGVSNDSPLFADLGGSRPSGGRVPSNADRSQSGNARPSLGGSATQLPSGNRPSRDIANRTSQLPTRNEGGTGTRRSNIQSQRPGGAGNFLGVASGVGAGVALSEAAANRPNQLPANRFAGGQQAAPPQQRANWNARSLNRDYKWRERVYKRNDAWNERGNQRQAQREDFQKNRDERWDNLQTRREDWQNSRKDLWDYRADRAEEIWDNARDFYDDVFDDVWWGYWGWGTWWPGYYPSDPWWWWSSANWDSLSNFVSVPADPTYADYGTNVVYEGDTVYVDNQALPAEQYDKPILEGAANVEQPPPPL